MSIARAVKDPLHHHYLPRTLIGGWWQQFLNEIFLGSRLLKLQGTCRPLAGRAGQLHGEASISLEAKASHLVPLHASSRSWTRGRGTTHQGKLLWQNGLSATQHILTVS